MATRRVTSRRARGLHHVSEREECDVIRLLVWIGVAMALLGIFYKILGRGGVNQEAFRDDYGHVVKKGASAPAPIAPSARTATAVAVPDSPVVVAGTARQLGRGLSFAFADESTVPARVAHLSCHGDPAPTD